MLANKGHHPRLRYDLRPPMQGNGGAGQEAKQAYITCHTGSDRDRNSRNLPPTNRRSKHNSEVRSKHTTSDPIIERQKIQPHQLGVGPEINSKYQLEFEITQILTI
jgi:hypothetical protein